MGTRRDFVWNGIKYIDIWLLFCLLIPVMEILLHTVEDHFNRR